MSVEVEIVSACYKERSRLRSNLVGVQLCVVFVDACMLFLFLLLCIWAQLFRDPWWVSVYALKQRGWRGFAQDCKDKVQTGGLQPV